MKGHLLFKIENILTDSKCRMSKLFKISPIFVRKYLSKLIFIGNYIQVIPTMSFFHK